VSAENLADVGRASERIAQLEEELASAKEKVAQLKAAIDAFRSHKGAAGEYTTAVNALLKLYWFSVNVREAVAAKLRGRWFVVA
jgi:cell division protein FtsB